MERLSTLTMVCQRISETSVVTAVKADAFHTQLQGASESERLLNKYPSVCLTHDAASRDTLTGKVTPKMDTAPPSEHQFCLQKRK